jgi:hypothetical protein
VDVGAALVADREATKAVEPGDRAFDHPPTGAEAAAMRRAPARQDRRDPARPETVTVRWELWPRSPWSASGRRRVCARRPRTAGKASTIGSRWVMSLTLATVTCATSGTPRASTMRWCLEPFLRRSVRRGPKGNRESWQPRLPLEWK